MSTHGRLQGKTAIVTGGAEGIGKATVELFVKEGASVVVVSRRPEQDAGLDHLDDGRVTYVQGDVTDSAAREEAIATALSEYGQLDVLVNNAAVQPVATLDDTDLADVRHTFEVNACAPLDLLVRAARVMKPGASIINVTSRLANVVIADCGVYGASKAALMCLTRYAAVDFGPRGIRVNAVAPGLTETPALGPWIAEMRDAGREGVLVDRNPQRRIGQPEEVAAAVLFLASSESSHVNGASLAVDGGYTVT